MTDSATSETALSGESASSQDQAASITADQVVQYLKSHPDFFMNQDELLLDLKIPHERGVAISLVERQLQLLRDHNLELRRRLGKLVDVARDNDRLFEQTRKLVLGLLESQDLEQATETLKDGLEQDFEVDFHSLILFTRQPANLTIREEDPDTADEILGDLLSGFRDKQSSGQKVICGRMKSRELEFLFPDNHGEIGSVALAPLNFPDNVGVLALGSRDENHFRASMGSLFIGYLSDVTSRVISRLL
ncbi:MAG: DUF484 family protein [Endozoicomonas sp.]|uniref:DUF484 family protein n=1 Tax=Endozoicomonas sp. TaxID=1892382 RepID=UPI003D9B0A4A